MQPELGLLILSGVVGFLGWLVKTRFSKVDDISNRMTIVETKLDVLGDINATLHKLRTDVEIIKSRMKE